jgi:hypothetical protein
MIFELSVFVIYPHAHGGPETAIKYQGMASACGNVN